ncbi:MAG: PD-(D/E)XK nuclease family protein, partial [Nitrospira sp.]|nr:PD-(D/E)XK nuclease family protein [Nitrospira sp.]
MDVISVSQINLYRSCSLKYKFTYIERLPKPFKSSSLALGATVHSAIEWLHTERMSGRDVTLEELYKVFSTDWYSQKVGHEIRYKEEETEKDLTEKGKALQALYFHKGPKEVLVVEHRFKVPLVDLTTGTVLDVPLVGYMDLVESDDTIDEVKTTASALDIENLDTQFQL